MSDIAIRVENLSKLYRIGPQERYKALRDTITDAFAAPFHRLRNPQSAVRNSDTIWALKDVSFEVKQGEVVGIIGRNGAGKSTLLKILSRITKPTEGLVEIHGRVGSLLEVGTGFHPELTGKENLYLNGAILGMKRAEIERKFDEIVAFAEVEKFLDTPVKHYSSGMYVRLAFAVAAHLEPEILLVDEVLAVGDAAFQRKCLGKMGDVAREGRTVLFVSHNMAAIENLCSKCMLLDAGRIVSSDSAAQTVAKYVMNTIADSAIVELPNHSMIKRMELRNSAHELTTVFRPMSEMVVILCLEPSHNIRRPVVGIGFNTSAGQRVFTVASYFSQSHLPPLEGQRETNVECAIGQLALAPGEYTLDVSAGETMGGLRDHRTSVARITVSPADVWGTGVMPSKTQGAALVSSQWRVV